MSFTPVHDLPRFYIALTVIGALELMCNAFLVVVLIGLLDGRPPRQSIRACRNIAAPFLFNVLLANAAASVYFSLGAYAVIVVLALIVAFRYVIGQIVAARKHAAQNADLAARQGELVAEILHAEDRAKQRLAESLHDGPLQQLLAAGQDLDEVRFEALESSRRARDAIAAAVHDLRAILIDLHPSPLDAGGLIGTINRIVDQQAQRGHVSIAADISKDAVGIHDRLVLAVVRELLVNAARHADASHIEVVVKVECDDAVVFVRDDGSGFRDDRRIEAIRRGHIGLTSLEQRVQAVGGSVLIESKAGHGTLVVARIPPEQSTIDPALGLRAHLTQRDPTHTEQSPYLASASTSSAALGGPQGPIRAQ
jgi:signal transduction histidine kinase